MVDILDQRFQVYPYCQVSFSLFGLCAFVQLRTVNLHKYFGDLIYVIWEEMQISSFSPFFILYLVLLQKLTKNPPQSTTSQGLLLVVCVPLNPLILRPYQGFMFPNICFLIIYFHYASLLGFYYYCCF